MKMANEIEPSNDIPDEVYIQFGENRIGTEFMIRKWTQSPFDGGTRFVREALTRPSPVSKEYDAADVKSLLAKSMRDYRAGMIELIRECAAQEKFKGLSGEEALNRVASKMEEMK